MNRKEQNKILNDKINANKRQYDLDRTNAEISAYSSGDLPKYEYLTKKDLGYKPNAFEQDIFEYSPLGKVFIDRLDKSDKKEGILKRLKDIEDKSNIQLLALRDINRLTIKGKYNGGYKSRDDDGDDDDDDDDDDTKRSYEIIVESYKNNEIVYKDIKNELNKINKAIEIYEKNKESLKKIPGFKDRINENKKFTNVLKKVIDDIIKIKLDRNHLSPELKENIDLSWINDPKIFNKINQDVTDRRFKDKKWFELLSIQSFLDKINDEYINNKKDALKKFKDVKNIVKTEGLKDIAKELEHSIFGYDNENKEESSGSRLKILTNKQMLNRLPILLAQIQAGNNSKLLKNEIRQILYSLYRSKVLTKTVYNNLIEVIRA